ncbi:MAG: hypothetical protein L0214_13250 [candidate division NC10 bacterium]|nr:hypothetical protein [candidate division NC10 bacterium]
MLELLWLSVAVGAALSYRHLGRSMRDRYENERHHERWVDCYSDAPEGAQHFSVY